MERRRLRMVREERVSWVVSWEEVRSHGRGAEGRKSGRGSGVEEGILATGVRVVMVMGVSAVV